MACSRKPRVRSERRLRPGAPWGQRRGREPALRERERGPWVIKPVVGTLGLVLNMVVGGRVRHEASEAQIRGATAALYSRLTDSSSRVGGQAMRA